jgi:hypothetical protein
LRLADFRALVTRLEAEVPPEYKDGVVDIEVSAAAVPHPVHADIYTMGECIPLEWSGSGADLQSRVVLYHGSFQAMARLTEPGEFDWREEAWETLTHELRHHLEWRANQKALEDYDWAVEQNFARHEGEGFDAQFYRSGEAVAEGAWKVEDDVFLEREPGGGSREPLHLTWHGRRYQVPLIGDERVVRFLVLDGLAEPPPGDAVLVVRPRRRWWELFPRREVVTEVVAVKPVDQ